MIQMTICNVRVQLVQLILSDYYFMLVKDFSCFVIYLKTKAISYFLFLFKNKAWDITNKSHN